MKKLFVKYFHELTEPEFEELCKIHPHWTYSELEKRYPQPPWCNYPEAIMGLMGCWSLIGFMVKDKKYCSKCECLMKVPK
jgi:hypothetical protein